MAEAASADLSQNWMKYSTFPLGPGWPESQTPRIARAVLLEPAADPLQHLSVSQRVPDHAPLADALATDLELRLDQREPAIAGAQAL